ncbi:MAG: sigma-54-dependent Fis family transcriptional regulator [Pseudomonadales bacterium]|nr:sigma-54-dependent Fis family transcriptional regulator [Pseudomonadales bacterium]
MIGLWLDNDAGGGALLRDLAAMGCAVRSVEGVTRTGEVDLLVVDARRMGRLDRLPRVGRPPMIAVFGEDRAEAGIAAVRAGVSDYLTDRLSASEVASRIFDWERRVCRQTVQRLSPATEKVFQLAERVAGTDVSVLVMGESGSGKEVMARMIHDHSKRRGGPFVGVNCAAIPENMLEAVLFGHEKGAFTGANESRPGKFEIADGGTLLLDEITEMATALQAKLLRVLQEREVERVGARAPRAVDVRVIATSNRDVREALADGVLREDLYYRLSVFPLRMPPLRDRLEEIPGLVRHFLHRHVQLGSGGTLRDVSAEVLELFSRYPWPGNVRELENVIQRALVLCDGDVIDARHVDLGVAQTEQGTGELSRRMLLAEGETIMAALRARGGRRAQAAQALGISERTLRYKIRRLKDMGVEVI